MFNTELCLENSKFVEWKLFGNAQFWRCSEKSTDKKPSYKWWGYQTHFGRSFRLNNRIVTITVNGFFNFGSHLLCWNSATSSSRHAIRSATRSTRATTANLNHFESHDFFFSIFLSISTMIFRLREEKLTELFRDVLLVSESYIKLSNFVSMIINFRATVKNQSLLLQWTKFSKWKMLLLIRILNSKIFSNPIWIVCGKLWKELFFFATDDHTNTCGFWIFECEQLKVTDNVTSNDYYY